MCRFRGAVTPLLVHLFPKRGNRPMTCMYALAGPSLLRGLLLGLLVTFAGQQQRVAGRTPLGGAVPRRFSDQQPSNPALIQMLELIRGTGLDACIVCLEFGPPRDAMRHPTAAVPRRDDDWVACRYRCPACGYGWWRYWPKHRDVRPAAAESNKPKPRTRHLAWDDEHRG